jgi:hypothetical protein
MNARHALLNLARTAAVGAALLATAAMASEPLIRTLVPPGGQRGTEVELRLRGQQLGNPQELLFYATGIQAVSVDAPEKRDGNMVIVKLAIAADCPLGSHALRLRTAAGLSNLVTFSVGALGEANETEPNSTFDTAETIALNTTVNGALEAEDIDYFVVEAKQGERITAEAEAMRLGGDMLDPRVAIYDANRQRLALADDTSVAWQDAVCQAIAPADGRYYIELREAAFGGSPQSRYRLHVGRFPRPTAVFPPGGPLGQSIELTWVGDARGPQPQTVVLPAEFDPEFGLFAQDAGGTAPWPNRFRLSTLPNALEAEPNNAPAEATEFTAPAALNGILAEAGDVDCYRFTAKKDASYDIRVYARSLRSPVDAVLSVQRKSGAAVGSNDDSEGPDSYLRFKAPADDEYTITLRDQLGRGGPDWVYRIEVAPIEPQLKLTLPERRQYIDMVAPVPRGNRTAMMVAVQRADVGGPVELALNGLPEGVSYETLPIDEGETQAPVVLTATAEAAPAGSLVDITGRIKTDALEVNGRLHQRTMLIRGRNNRDVWGRDTYRMATAVIEPVPFDLEIIAPKAPLVQNGAMNLKVVAHRRDDFQAPIALTMLYNPSGMSSSAGVTIAQGQSEATIPLTAAGGAKTNTWRIAVLGAATVGEGPVVVSSKLTELVVSEPFVAVTIPQGVVDQGQSTTLTVAVETRNEFTGKATAELVGLPFEVSAEPIEFDKDAKELAFTLNSTLKSPQGRHKTLMCRITLEASGEPVVHLLGPGELRIRPAGRP